MTDNEKLSALEEIRQLKARYFRGVDEKDAAVLRAVFTDDAVTDFREESPDRDPALLQHDPDAFVRNTLYMLEGITTAHAGFNPEITLLSPSEATGRWSMTDRLWAEEGGPGRLPFKTLAGWGAYHDTYRKTASGWRIASTQLRRSKVIFG